MPYTPARELVRLIKSGELTPREVMEETLARIEALNPALNAFVSLHPEGALKEAEKLTEHIASGRECGPLAGIPVGVKDLEDAKGFVTSFGSVPFKENVAVADSTQVARLKAAGAIVIGKTNTPEFGFTGFTKNRVFGVTRNPWDRDRTPGGSSGGSAAAVAAGMVPITTGSDAGGSIRIPASYCGCFGLKPSFGRIPLGPLSQLLMFDMWSPGPLTWDVRDAARYLDCVSGYHPCDPKSLPAPALSYEKCLERTVSGLRMGFSPSLGYARVAKDVLERVQEAVKGFEEMGHTVELWEGRLPDSSATWANLMNCDLLGQLRHTLRAYRDDIGKTLVRSLENAGSLTMADQIDAQRVRSKLHRKLWRFFEDYDLLLTPTMPTEAFGAKGPPPSQIDGKPIPLLGAVAFTYPFNLTGHPAASVPAGFTENGLPVGLQIIGPHLRDDLVLQTAHACEEARPWKGKRPNMNYQEESP
jgi:aspartyl-tRNA(Asn)/glutamyl-tRNA(Gln) amidotransferase subunit A